MSCAREANQHRSAATLLRLAAPLSPPAHRQRNGLANEEGAREEVALQRRERAEQVGDALVVHGGLEVEPADHGVDPERRGQLDLCPWG